MYNLNGRITAKVALLRVQCKIERGEIVRKRNTISSREVYTDYVEIFQKLDLCIYVRTSCIRNHGFSKRRSTSINSGK